MGAAEAVFSKWAADCVLQNVHTYLFSASLYCLKESSSLPALFGQILKKSKATTASFLANKPRAAVARISWTASANPSVSCHGAEEKS